MTDYPEITDRKRPNAHYVRSGGFELAVVVVSIYQNNYISMLI